MAVYLKDTKYIKYWDSNKNRAVNIDEVNIGSNISYYWRCPICKREWKTRVYHLINDTNGCPNCKKEQNRIKKVNEVGLIKDEMELMKEWDYKTNNKNKIYPDKLSKKSKTKVAWICTKNKHRWESSIYNRVVHHRGCPYCTNQKILKGYNDLETINPELACEWNYDKNTLMPHEVGTGTNKKYWWKCEKGHEWEASVSNRHRLKVGCPYCSQSISFPEKAIFYYFKKHINNIIPNYRSKDINNKEIDIFLPDLKIGIEYDGLAFHNRSRDKEKDRICKNKGITLLHVAEKKDSKLIIENQYIYYDPKNKEQLDDIINILLNSILQTNEEKYNVNIERDKNSIYNIIAKSNKQKALFNTNPKLKKIWNYGKNKGLNPDLFSSGSGLSVWWKCKKGHEWQASISNIAKGHGCPYCSGREAVKGKTDIFSNDDIFKQLWNYEKNSDTDPLSIKPQSNVKLWWKCEKGHEWQAAPCSIYRGTRCPICANQKLLKGYNDFATKYPQLLKEWNYEVNNKLEIRPDEIIMGGKVKVWWKCEKGHEWESTISNRVSLKRGCPICGRIKAWNTRKNKNNAVTNNLTTKVKNN